MFPIAKDKNNNFNFNSLCEDIITKSKKAIKNNRVLTHSILLYTRRHGPLVKLLNDEYLYNALDEISGRYINIYHAVAENPNVKNNPQIFELMIPLNVNVNRDRSEYNSVIDRFRFEYNINTNINNPVLFFFTSNDGKTFDNTYTVILRGQNAEEYYTDLTLLFESVTKAINDVLDENINNQNEILNLAIANIINYNFKRVVKKTTNSSIYKILGFLKPTF